MDESSKINLTHLSDCLLMTILSYLDATSLYYLSRTCTRLKHIIKDASLWKYIDARNSPNELVKLKYCIDRVNKDTTHLFLRAPDNVINIVNDNFFVYITIAEKLTVLALENQYIYDEITLSSFPKTLIELSLRNTQVDYSERFFKQSNKALPNLKVLILDDCHWVNTSSLMSLSRFEKLEIISFYRCRGLDNSIPYLSLAGSYGFKNLKIFDARLSVLGNAFLKSIYKSNSLLAVYLQNEDVSYKLDYYNRKMEILKGSKPINHPDDKVEEFNEEGTNNPNSYDLHVLDDRGLLDYINIKGVKTDELLPKSILYRDPYEVCHCHYTKRRLSGKSSKFKTFRKGSLNHDSSDDDDDNDDDNDSKKDLRNRIKQVRDRTCSTRKNLDEGTSIRDTQNGPTRLNNGVQIDIDKLQNARSRLRSIYVFLAENENVNININNENDVQELDVVRVSINSIPTDDPQGERNVHVEDANENRNNNIYWISTNLGSVRQNLSNNDNPPNNENENNINEVRNQQDASINIEINSINNSHINEEPICTEKNIQPLGNSSQPTSISETSTIDDKVRRATSVNNVPSTSKQASNSDIRNTQPQPSTSSVNVTSPECSNLNKRKLPDEPDDLNNASKRRRIIIAPMENNEINVEGNQIEPDVVHLQPRPRHEIQHVTIYRYPELKKDIKVPLRRLSLRGYRHITDNTLHYLRNLNLELLDLTYTNVSIEGIEGYLSYNPNCRILHRKYCVCRPQLHF